MLTKEESDAIKIMIRDWPTEPRSFGTDAANVLMEAVERETETDAGPPELHGIILGPIIHDGKLTQVKIEIRDAPGLSATFTARAAAEFRDGLNYLLKVKDWDEYRREFGWLDKTSAE